MLGRGHPQAVIPLRGMPRFEDGGIVGDVDRPEWTRPLDVALAAAGASSAPRGIFTQPTATDNDDDTTANVLGRFEGIGTSIFGRLLQKLSPGFGAKRPSFGKVFDGVGEDAIHGTFGGAGASHGGVARAIHVIVDNWPAPNGGALGRQPTSQTWSDWAAAGGTNSGPSPDILPAVNQIIGTGAAGTRTPVTQTPGFLAALSKVFGGGAGTGTPAPGGFDFASAMDSFGGFLAEGGDADPGKVYGVAEAGEAEWITPRTSSTVIPASKMIGDTFHIEINAPGADLGVVSRIDQIMSGAHNSAIVTSIRANAEMAKRRPRMA
jgi:hypothetical protein